MAEGTRLLSEYGGQTPSRVRIPPSPFRLFEPLRPIGPAAVRIAAHDDVMPRISLFYGIVITMYFYDHEPPHFHAQYAEHHAVIAIDGGTVLVGNLPGRALKLVSEWVGLHREELEAAWEQAKHGSIPEAIEPLP